MQRLSISSARGWSVGLLHRFEASRPTDYFISCLLDIHQALTVADCTGCQEHFAKSFGTYLMVTKIESHGSDRRLRGVTTCTVAGSQLAGLLYLKTTCSVYFGAWTMML